MNQPTLFDAPPIAGSTKLARACSRSGARAVVETWSHRQSVMLQLLAGGPKSRQELSALSKYPINSVCSCIGNLLQRGLIERHDIEPVQIAGYTTYRERFRIRRRNENLTDSTSD